MGRTLNTFKEYLQCCRCEERAGAHARALRENSWRTDRAVEWVCYTIRIPHLISIWAENELDARYRVLQQLMDDGRWWAYWVCTRKGYGVSRVGCPKDNIWLPIDWCYVFRSE